MLAVKNEENEIKDEIVESLLRVCRKKIPEVFGRYFKVKAQRLGVPVLSRYDLFAPIKPERKTFSFNQAFTEVIESFKDFDHELAELAQKVYASKRLSACISNGKFYGAFSLCAYPGDIPWVSMNYEGYRRDFFNLAHELGHAVHFLLASNLSFLEFHPAPPLAEMASCLGEMLMAKRLREKSDQSDLEVTSFELMDVIYETVGRTAFFTIFEYEAHRLIKQGAGPSEISEAYLKNLKEHFGQAVLVPDDFRFEWLSIDQFFRNPFFFYLYDFGNLLVYSLWALFQNDRASFCSKMKALLALGGSASTEQALSQVGFGPLDDHFWTRGFEVIESFIPKD
jgi:oligoendopeptidase F